MKLYQKVVAGAAGLAASLFAVYKTMCPWLKYDLELMKAGARLSKAFQEVMESPELLIDIFEKVVAQQPEKVFVIFEDKLFTYGYINDMANRMANVAQAWGLQAKDNVAIVIENSPEYIWTYLGLLKLGVSIALVNHNLRLNSLLHCIMCVDPKYLIVGQNLELHEAALEILEDLSRFGVKVCLQGLGSTPPPPGVSSFDLFFNQAYASKVSPLVRRDVTKLDTCCYIYTSGTTGNPKAVPISQMKACGTGTVMDIIDFNSSDVVYTTLPLYHSSACIGFYGAILKGATMVLRRKFSASHFWADCRDYNVTVIQYIGELLRYLVAQPSNPLDATHKVRAAFGNGLRKDIWTEVKERFKIPLIAEFFAATEGTTLLFNLSNRPGAIGRISPFMNLVSPYKTALVKFDQYTAQPIRDRNGRCIKVGPGEPGLFLSQIAEALIKNGKFTVYKGSEASSEKKLVRDAFELGDMYFNYGDVFILDKDFFAYFQDRIGDTFRWKGENVSTLEVANVMCALPFLHDANVYGVTIPGHDGRAGMAAVTLRDNNTLGEAELKRMFDHVTEKLPAYARPKFVRYMKEAILTATLKQKKVELSNEGYDQNIIQDPLYFYDKDASTYSPLTSKALGTFLKSNL